MSFPPMPGGGEAKLLHQPKTTSALETKTSDPLQSCQNRGCDKATSNTQPLLICSGCKLASYCCKQCQRTDWKRHKQNCTPVKVALPADAAIATGSAYIYLFILL